MRGVNHHVHQVIHGRLDVNHVHPRCGNHHVAGRHIGHANDAFEHGAGLGSNDVVVFGLGQGFDQLVGRVRAGVDKFSEFLKKSTLVFFFRGMRGVGV